MWVCRNTLAVLGNCKRSQCVRWLCTGLIAIAVIEFFIFNIVILYMFHVVSRELSEISSPNHQASLLDRLQNNNKINGLLRDAKLNGYFVSLLQETLERVFVIRHSSASAISGGSPEDLKGRQMKEISYIGLDVSHSREATYIYSRILSRTSIPFQFMVVDIGSNDGFLSSNSFNFIQWGWDAVLVEPQPLEGHVAQENIKRYVNRYGDGAQSVMFVQAALGSTDGSVEFIITKDSLGMESHIKVEDRSTRDGDVVVQVPCLTVKTLATEYNIPKKFGILSIDAEGTGAEILKQWIDLNFRPAYIIYEFLHRQEPTKVTLDYLAKHGYHHLGTLGWNLIFEYSYDSAL